MMIGWTTVARIDQAEALAQGLVDARLAACVQIDGPVSSFYLWQNKREETSEVRLTVKFLSESQQALESWLGTNHPYSVPEWVVVHADRVSEKYLSWAQTNLHSPPL